jgi:small subunit ribosomal protein S16
MAVKIRLTRTGKKKQPTYRVVVMDSRKPRDGRYIEQIGRYDAREDPSLVEIDNDRALDWLRKGAQPTERAQKLLEISGAWAQFRVDKGEIYTVGEHEAKEWPEKVHVVEPAAEAGAPDEGDDAEAPVEGDDDTEAPSTPEGSTEEAQNLEETE